MPSLTVNHCVHALTDGVAHCGHVQVATTHERYDEVNRTLQGRVAADSLKPAIVSGGATLEHVLTALKASKVARVAVKLHGNFGGLKEEIGRASCRERV